MESSLQGYKPSEVHCIEFIEKNVDSNVTKLAESMYMTKGAISKLTKKLIEKGLIKDYQKTNNKKEVFFKLTQQGRVVFDIHEKLHKEFQERDESVFKHVTEEQFDHMLDFIELYSKHLDTEIKKQGLDIMK
ncbi:DNA-binding transcriptional regulator, MarR family [Paenibacillus polysaccharolyticus]|uniref:DNA-binding transcriptional regulator, MarR family n=2 Tax=Paenibacillus polysaccharolyticus TaxID=582692 RepID=A0A1G5GRE8_9BACL|nr:DNA-binding transcriptional regulator, MarR family [Paenibacillus polysaccharolyticus]